MTPLLISTTPRWIVVSKPAGWLTIPPSQTSSHPILVDWLRENYGPVWVVHRLDLETTGVILFARTAADHAQINTWFQNRQTRKIYHCLAIGVPHSPILKFNEPIRGSPSLTQVEVMENYVEGFFGKVILKTGRRHQIRIHLSEAGHALWGDSQYGGPNEISWATSDGQGVVNKDNDVEPPPSLKVSRVALHASSLEIPTGEKFEAPLTADFTAWLCALQKKGTHV